MADDLDIAKLRTLVAIEEYGGFAPAADALRLSQPAVSQHVRALERHLRRQLMEKHGRRMRFTAAGRHFLSEARRIIAVHDDVVRGLDILPQRPIVVGSPEAAAEQTLPELLALLRAAYPDRQVQFHIDRSPRLVDAVVKGDVDVSLVLGGGGELGGTQVGTLPLRWYGSVGRAPLDPRGPVPLVAFTEPCGMREWAIAALAARRQPVEVITESASLEGIIAAVRAGVGVAVLPTAGTTPEGLAPITGLPPLSDVPVQMISRRGVEADVERTASTALRGFFLTRLAS